MRDLTTQSYLLKRVMSELRRTPMRVTDTTEHIDNELIEGWLRIESEDADWTHKWIDKVTEMQDKNYAQNLSQLDDDRAELEAMMLARVVLPTPPKPKKMDTNYRNIHQMSDVTDAVLNHNNPFAQATTSNMEYTHISQEGVRNLQLTKVERLTRQQVDGHSIVTTQPSLRVIDNNIKLEIGDDILTEQKYKLEWRE